MAKRARNALDPEEVLRGRSRPDAVALCALIRSVNPTGIELPAAERSRRYALKSKLQSVLVLRFGAEIDVVADPAEGPGFVLLRHRPTASSAGHALLAELEGEARAWVQYQLDAGGSGAPEGASPAPVPRPASPRRSPPESPPGSPPAGSDTAEDLLHGGRLAVLEYDYDTRRSLLEQALARSDGRARCGGGAAGSARGAARRRCRRAGARRFARRRSAHRAAGPPPPRSRRGAQRRQAGRARVRPRGSGGVRRRCFRRARPARSGLR
jgi:hypothetical protein